MEAIDVFPVFEEVAGALGLMKSSIEEHQAFDAGLEEFMTYIGKVEAGEAQYSGQELKVIIESFAPATHQHTVNEISSLPALHQYLDKVGWGCIRRRRRQRPLKENRVSRPRRYVASPVDGRRREGIGMSDHGYLALESCYVAVVLTCTVATFGNGVYQWPPNLPWIAKMITPYWRFGPADSAGQRRGLPFVRAG
ncbi:hypothetical protein PG994_000073 [Apiospora phragmitis]|uniref:Uncharacterized protein n=1 Tax=Apiospora phragmitis TaxID=2905665 RepID=A0ABR1X5B0_9PEZI